MVTYSLIDILLDNASNNPERDEICVWDYELLEALRNHVDCKGVMGFDFEYEVDGVKKKERIKRALFNGNLSVTMVSEPLMHWLEEGEKLP